MAKTRRVNRKGSKDSRKGKKGTRKARKGSDWSAAVKRVYGELKRKNSNAKLGDAMKEASRRKKAGTL
jgi:hypothetical protein